MKYRQLLIVIIGVYVLLPCCSDVHNGGSIESLFSNHEGGLVSIMDSIELEAYGILRPEGLAIWKECFIIQKGDGNEFIALIRPSSDECVFYVKKGRGPKEIWMSPSMMKVTDNQLQLYDISRQRLITISLEQKPDSDDNISITPFPVHMEQKGEDILPYRLFALATGGNKYYASGFISGMWYSALDIDGFPQSGIEYVNHPSLDNLSPEEKAILHISSQIVVHPNGKQVASALVHGAALSFSLMEKGQLKEVARHVFYPPLIESSHERGMSTLAYKPESRRSCCALKCDDKYIYYLYSGRDFNSQNPWYQGCDLYVFDWSGKPIRHYILQQDAIDFEIQGQLLFTISSHPKSIIYVHKIEDLGASTEENNH